MLMRFEKLPENVRALILAKLAMEITAARAHSIHHLAKLQRSDVGVLWRTICRKAAQPACTIPAEVLRSS